MGSDPRLARGVAQNFRRHWPGYAVVALAGVAYFYRLGSTSLWYDEAYSAWFAAMPWDVLVKAMEHADGQGLPYYAFLHLWRAFGDNETALRIPSVVAALVAIAATYVLGFRLFGRTAATIAAALLAANPLFVFLAREARFYSFAIACTTLAMSAFVRHSWTAYTVAMIASGFGHLFTVLIAAAQIVYATFTRRVPVRPFAVSLALFVAATAPLALIAARGDLSHLAWIPPTTLAGIGKTIISLAGTLQQLALIEGVLLVVAIVAARRESRDGDALLWCWLSVPLLLTIAFSFVHPALVERYISLSLPALSLLVARGIGTLPLLPTKVVGAAVAALAAVNATMSYTSFEDWRGGVESMLGRAQAGDALIVVPADRTVPVAYYLENGGGERPTLLDVGNTPFRLLDFAAVARRFPRLWLIVHMPEFEDDPELDPAIRSAESELDAAYRPLERTKFRRVTVVLWSRR